MTVIDLTGIGNLGLNIGAGIGVRDAFKGAGSVKSGVGNALTGGAIFDVFGRSEGKSIGGSVLVTSLTNTTTAEIGDGAALHIGSTGTLSVTAAESLLRIDIAQSGGLSGGGALAFAGSGLGFRDRETTLAGLVSGPLGVTITGGGAVTIAATSGAGTDANGAADPASQGIDVGIAGSIVKGEGGATQIGVSVLVNDISNTTAAFIGNAPPVDEVAAPTGKSTLQVGALIVKAVTEGGTYDFGVAGSVNTNSKPPEVGRRSAGRRLDTPKEATKPAGSSNTNGIGVAGSALVNVDSWKRPSATSTPWARSTPVRPR